MTGLALPPSPAARRLAVMTAVVAALLVAGLVAAFAVRPGPDPPVAAPSETSQQPPTSEPPTTAEPTPTPTTAEPTPTTAEPPTTAPPPGPAPLPTGTRAIPAGFYRTPTFRPPLAFHLQGGWRRPEGELNDVLTLPRTTRAAALFSVVRVERTVDPEPEFASIEAARSADVARPAPDDLVGWVRTHPRLAAGTPEPFQLGTLSGTRLDATVAAGYPICPGAPSCVVLFRLSGPGVFLVLEGHRNRLYAFDVRGTPVLAFVEAPADQFDAFVAEVEAVLATVELPA